MRSRRLQLNHSNVCHLYDVGPDYLVLEYVEGASPVGPMPFEEALPIIRQLIDGIEASHEKNIIHRDLKTANTRSRLTANPLSGTASSPWLSHLETDVVSCDGLPVDYDPTPCSRDVCSRSRCSARV